MTVLEIIFGVIVPFVIAVVVSFMVGMEIGYSIFLNKPVKTKIEPVREKSDYLVVCPNLNRAAMLCDQLARYLYNTGTRCRVIKNSMTFLIDIMGETTKVRFTSEVKYYEASAGFHGWVVDAHQVEEWLDAAEKEET